MSDKGVSHDSEIRVTWLDSSELSNVRHSESGSVEWVNENWQYVSSLKNQRPSAVKKPLLTRGFHLAFLVRKGRLVLAPDANPGAFKPNDPKSRSDGMKMQNAQLPRPAIAPRFV